MIRNQKVRQIALRNISIRDEFNLDLIIFIKTFLQEDEIEISARFARFFISRWMKKVMARASLARIITIKYAVIFNEFSYFYR